MLYFALYVTIILSKKGEREKFCGKRGKKCASIDLGLTGTGKTTEIFSRAMDSARKHQPTILLVPEQFSFQAERTVYTALTGEDALSILC